MKPEILLSFDVEEFDMPLEYGQMLSEEEQLRTGHDGLLALMDTLAPFDIEATYFTTANFANHYPGSIRLIAQRNEIASHTYYHSRFEPADLANSRTALQQISNQPVTGIRMPRMRPVGMPDVTAAGYFYDSSINPAYVPGRYNNRSLPRTVYTDQGMLRVPVSVSPRLRIPLFWLSFKNFPYAFYIKLVRDVLRKDGYVCLYFHPWEFIPLDAFRIPAFTKRGAGNALQKKLSRLIRDLGAIGEFTSMDRFVHSLELDGRKVNDE